MAEYDVDVLIVGAGVAGIAAARAALGAGCQVAILEAMDRPGGRAYTNTAAPVPFDHGGQFFAQAQSLNTAMYPIAQQFGIVTFPADDVPRSLYSLLDPTKLADDVEQGIFYASYAAIEGAVLERGVQIDAGEVPDVSLLETLTLAGVAQLPYRRLILQLFSTVVVGVAPERQSTVDIYRFLRFSPMPFVYPPRDSLYVPGGLGTFVAMIAEGLPISLSTPVARVTRDAGGVVVTTSSGAEMRARTAIVTASTGAVRAIDFEPALPPAYAAAFKALPMGNAYKAMLSFDGRPFDGRLGTQAGVQNNCIALVDGEPPAFSVNYFAQYYPNAPACVVVTCEDAVADAYEAMGPQAAARDILARLEGPFPGAIAAWTGFVDASAWRGNPYTRGGLSAATPGNSPARVLLQTPIEQQVWFAGDALSVSSHSLLHGAWASGNAAGFAAARASRHAFSQP